MPDSAEANGRILQLNGIGLRTYSLLRIRIYVAGLYLQHPSTDPEQILDSLETKLLAIRFVRDVSVEQSRNAWREGLENNCLEPCQITPDDIERFLAAIPPMHAGDDYSLLFTRSRVTVTVNGLLVGVISQPDFARAMLAAFIGRKPASESLKQALLAGHG